MISSTFRVTSGKAGAPSLVESFIPLYCGGLCEAVKLMRQIAAFVRITRERVGVRSGPAQRRTRKELSAIMLANSSVNCSPRNLVSYPTTITLPGAFVAAKWEQIAL